MTNPRIGKLINKIKNSGVVKTGSMSKDGDKKVDELSMSRSDVTKSGLRKPTDTDKLKKDLERLKKGLKKEAFASRRPGNQMSDLYKLYNLAMKAMPGSPKQKEIVKKIDALRKELKINEDVPTVSTGDIPNPKDTVMGPRKKKKNHTSSIHDKRYKKSLTGQSKPVLLKRFRDYYDAKGIGG